MNVTSYLVVNPPPIEGSVLGRCVTGDSRLGPLLYWIVFCHAVVAALRKQQASSKDNCLHGIRRQWCALCKNRGSDPVLYKAPCDFIAGQPCKEKDASDCRVSTPHELATFLDDLARKHVHNDKHDHYNNWREFVPRPRVSNGDDRLAEVIHECLNPIEPVASPYNEAWDELRQKALQERYSRHLNFCPRCWVARVQGVVIPKERACLGCIGLKRLDEAEATKAAKRAKTLAEYCAEFTKKNNRKLAAKGWAGYSPEEFDRDILKSRGSVMNDAILQFERRHSRRLNKRRIR